MDPNQKVKTIQIITATAVIIGILMIVSLILNLITFADVNKKKQELAAQLAALKSQSETLSSEIIYKSSDSYIEQYAREYLGMIGEDEELFSE